jgi:hypothetical protein
MLQQEEPLAQLHIVRTKRQQAELLMASPQKSLHTNQLKLAWFKEMDAYLLQLLTEHHQTFVMVLTASLSH